jgi:hypothetical protein
LEFYVAQEIWDRVNDPTINLPLQPFDEHRGSSLANLLAFGLTEEALRVMVDMLEITVLVENYIVGSLSNPDVIALTARRDQTHHNLLSLPTGAVLGDSLMERTNFYECCRLAAIMFATATLFPMPRSTCVPQKLVKEIKRYVDQTSILILHGGGRAFFIWVLMLGGTAAVGLPERPWFEGTLVELLWLEGVSRWSEVKRILASFLWMDSACDEGAMGLWDELALRRLSSS